MSNHAYVLPKEMPSSEQIDKDVRDICSRKFPQLTLEFEKNKFYPDGVWLLRYKEVDDIRMIFWVGLWNDDSCIEFRHSYHGAGNWLWWVEYEIREELALRYNAMVVDDCDGEFEKPQTDKFDTYCEYLRKTDQQFFLADDNYIKFLREVNPPEVLNLIGNV